MSHSAHNSGNSLLTNPTSFGRQTSHKEQLSVWDCDWTWLMTPSFFNRLRRYIRLLLTDVLTYLSDIDECRSVPDVCANGHCINNPGSYVCECVAGFRPSLDRTRCIGEYPHQLLLPFNGTLKPHSNGPQCSNMVIGTLAVVG